MPKRSRKVQPFPQPDEEDEILENAQAILKRIIERQDKPGWHNERIDALQRLCREAAEFAKVGQLPQRLIDALTVASRGGPVPDTLLPITPEDFPKEPPAATLGRLGGLKGGHARAANMSPEQRRRSAKKAARARWAKS